MEDRLLMTCENCSRSSAEKSLVLCICSASGYCVFPCIGSVYSLVKSIYLKKHDFGYNYIYSLVFWTRYTWIYVFCDIKEIAAHLFWWTAIFSFSSAPNDAGILKLYASDKSDNKQRKEYRRKCADNPDEDPSCEGTLFLNFFHFSCAAFRGFRPAL